MITNKEVKHIAELARLGLDGKEIKKFQKELSSILIYVEKLKKADISNVETNDRFFEVKNTTRQDTKSSKPKEINRKLLNFAPKTKDAYLKVKSVL